jgi:hypothetical protein
VTWGVSPRYDHVARRTIRPPARQPVPRPPADRVVRPAPPITLVPTTVLSGTSAALRFMLIVHGLVAVYAGLGLATDTLNGKAFAVLSLMPGWPWSWGLTLAAAGFATVTGRLTDRLAVARAGVACQAVWYVVQTVGLTSAFLTVGSAKYGIGIYAGLAALTYAHLRWLTDHGDWRP